jgi:hypothetical protein
MRWLEDDGHLSVFRANSNYSNGNTRDREGRLITCEHDSRRVTRTELDGAITVLIDSFQGKKLNAPNDVVVAADGAVWFTDPGYGIFGNYEGHLAEPELPPRVYRLDPKSGQASIVADDFDKPNGLAFSADEKKLYIIDSGLTHGGRANIRKRRQARERESVRRELRARLHRRRAHRHRRQCVVQHGLGGSQGGRRSLLRAERRSHREDPSAGDLRQSVLRRQEAQPSVHDGEHLGLCDLCRDPRWPEALTADTRSAVIARLDRAMK